MGCQRVDDLAELCEDEHLLLACGEFVANLGQTEEFATGWRTWQAQLESIGAPNRELGVEVGLGMKAVSRLGTERLVHSAIQYAVLAGAGAGLAERR